MHTHTHTPLTEKAAGCGTESGRHLSGPVRSSPVLSWFLPRFCCSQEHISFRALKDTAPSPTHTDTRAPQHLLPPTLTPEHHSTTDELHQTAARAEVDLSTQIHKLSIPSQN